MSSPTKMYIEIVKQIRFIISEDGIKAGDKIPSERELSDRLKVGRSSVREALRALELLGLIETRRGEGTFLKDFTEHHLVELLGTFILENEKKKKDLIETKFEVEKSCLQLMVAQRSKSATEELSSIVESTHFSHDDFFKVVSNASGNQLIQRIWSLVSSYSNTISTEKTLNKALYQELIQHIEKENIEALLKKYNEITSQFVDV